MATLVFCSAAAADAQPDYATLVGVCTDVSLSITTNLTLGIPGGVTSIGFNGNGTCTGTGSLAATGTLSGHVTSAGAGHMTCAGGVATGFGSFSIPGVSTGTAGFTVVLTMVGAAVTMEMASVLPTSPTFVGTGAFVQDPTSTVDCADGGMTSTTWCGSITFAGSF